MAITLAQKYLRVIDAIYVKESLTSRLDAANGEIDFSGVDTAKILNMSFSGLGDYDRQVGYRNGTLATTWETFQITKDRAIKLDWDRYDNEESLSLLDGKVPMLYTKEKIVPEVDAYRFAKYSAGAGNTANADVVVGTTDVASLIDNGLATMGDKEVPLDDVLIYISWTGLNAMQQKITRILANEGTVNREVYFYNGHPVIPVPQARFNTLVTLHDGDGNWGFEPTAGGYKINFMIVKPDAVKNAVKFTNPKIFTPDQNILKDATCFEARIHHDAFVLSNHADGVYLHRAATANS